MITVEPIYQEKKRAFRGLAWLAICNLLLAVVLTAVSVMTWRLGFSSNAFFQVMGFNANVAFGVLIGGLVHSWAVISALIPARRFVGLLWMIAFALATGAIEWGGFAVRAPDSAFESISMVRAGLLSLSTFAIAQGLRLLGGQRLVLRDEAVSVCNRFGTADLIEWTFTIGVFLGFGSLMGWFHNLMLLASGIGLFAIMTLPLAIAIVSQNRRPWVWIAGAMCLAFTATLVRNLLSWHFLSPDMLKMPIWMLTSYNVTIPACYLIATALNFSIVRRLGFRWLIPHKPALVP